MALLRPRRACDAPDGDAPASPPAPRASRRADAGDRRPAPASASTALLGAEDDRRRRDRACRRRCVSTAIVTLSPFHVHHWSTLPSPVVSRSRRDGWAGRPVFGSSGALGSNVVPGVDRVLARRVVLALRRACRPRSARSRSRRRVVVAELAPAHGAVGVEVLVQVRLAVVVQVDDAADLVAVACRRRGGCRACRRRWCRASRRGCPIRCRPRARASRRGRLRRSFAAATRGRLSLPPHAAAAEERPRAARRPCSTRRTSTTASSSVVGCRAIRASTVRGHHEAQVRARVANLSEADRWQRPPTIARGRLAPACRRTYVHVV